MNAKTKDYIIWAVIAVVFGLLGMFLTKAFTPKCPEVTTITKHDTLKADTIFRDIPKYQPTFVYSDTGSFRIITKRDTILFIDDYMKYKIFDRKLLDDSTALIQLIDTLHMNGLLNGKLTYLNRKPTVINNTYNQITNPSSNQLYLGIGVGSDFKDVIQLKGSISLKTCKDALYSLGIDYTPVVSHKPVYSISRSFKIKF